MKKHSNPLHHSLLDFEKAVRAHALDTYVLRLYVAGTTSQSQRAVLNLKKVCEEYLYGRYELEVVDVYVSPLKAKEDQVIAVPTLIKLSPPPRKMILGDLSQEKKVLTGLGIKKKEPK